MNEAMQEVVADLLESLDEAYKEPAPQMLLRRVADLSRSMYTTTDKTGHTPSANLTLAYLATIETVCILKTSPAEARARGVFNRLTNGISHASHLQNEQLVALAYWYLGIGMLLQQFPPGEHPAYSIGGVKKVIRAFRQTLAAVMRTGDCTRKAVGLSIMAEMYVWALEPEHAIQHANLGWVATFEAQLEQEPPPEHAWLMWCTDHIGGIVVGQGRHMPRAFDARELLYRPGELLGLLPQQ